MHGFYPNDRTAYGLYQVIAEEAGVALFHTEQTSVEFGLPGGIKIRLKYFNPTYMDDVAVGSPKSKIILAHLSFPLAERSLSRGKTQA